MPKWTKWVKAFLKSDTSPPSHFSLGCYTILIFSTFSSQCSSTRNWSWLLTVYLFLWTLKMVCKSPYKYKSVDFKFHSARNWTLLWEMFVHWLWSHVKGWSKQKLKIIVFHCCLFFYRLRQFKSSIQASLDIIYDFYPDASENRPWHTHIQLYFTLFFKDGMTSTIFIYHKCTKSFIESIPLPVSYAMKIYWNNFLI